MHITMSLYTLSWDFGFRLDTQKNLYLYLRSLWVRLPGVHAVVVGGPEAQEDTELVTRGGGQLRAGDHSLDNAVGACPGE